MRTRSLLVAFLTALLLATGCSGAGTPAGRHLTMWVAEDDPGRVAAIRAILARFQRQSGIGVSLVPVDEDQLPAQVTNASGAGDLPDVLGALPLGALHALAADGLTDDDAAGKVLDALGRETFVKRALDLVSVGGRPVAVPSDTWTQLLLYRKDLFARAHLAVPDSFAAIRAAAARLNRAGTAGIVAATAPGEVFTQQTFEYFAVANGCQLTDPRGAVTLTSRACVDTFAFYVDLIRHGSVAGAQDVATTRAAYLAGKAAMLVWSSFVLDELAGLQDNPRPTCPPCRADPRFLASHSGVVTAVRGPDAAAPSQFGEVTGFAITKDGNVAAARRLVTSLLSDGYLDWLGFAPEGKFPTRRGTREQPDRYVRAWQSLPAGVDRKQPLAAIYPADVLQRLAASTQTMRRWGFEQGQGRLVGAQLEALPVPAALADALDGRLDPRRAAEQAQARVEELARSVR